MSGLKLVRILGMAVVCGSHARQVVAGWLRIPLGLLEFFWIGSLMALVEVYPINPLLNLHVNFSLFDQS